MEHLEVTDFIRSHYDEFGRICSKEIVYEMTDIDYDAYSWFCHANTILQDDILEMVRDLFGSNMLDHALEVFEAIYMEAAETE